MKTCEEDILERLRRYNPYGRTNDERLQISQDIFDAAEEIAKLRYLLFEATNETAEAEGGRDAWRAQYVAEVEKRKSTEAKVVAAELVRNSALRRAESAEAKLAEAVGALRDAVEMIHDANGPLEYARANDWMRAQLARLSPPAAHGETDGGKG